MQKKRDEFIRNSNEGYKTPKNENQSVQNGYNYQQKQFYSPKPQELTQNYHYNQEFYENYSKVPYVKAQKQQKETFSNMIDRNNRSMVHLLRKY